MRSVNWVHAIIFLLIGVAVANRVKFLAPIAGK
jgi:hypothetical protein